MNRELFKELKERLEKSHFNNKGWARTKCIFCIQVLKSQGRSQSLSLHRTGFYRCWRCETKGKIDGFEPVYSTDNDASVIDEIVGLPDEYVSLSDRLSKSSIACKEVYTFLYRRNITDQMISHFRIGACFEGNYRDRVIIPITDRDDSILGFVGRSWKLFAEPRYKNSSNHNNSDLIWNGNILNRRDIEVALITEGVFDAMRHYPNACALLGKPREAQLERLSNSQKPICFVLDGDAWAIGQSCARLLALSGKCRVGWVRLSSATDPADIAPDKLAVMVREAMEVQ